VARICSPRRGLRSLVSHFPLVVLSAFILASCGDQEPTVKPPAQTFPSSEATNATTVFLTGAVVTTKIKSGRIISYSDRDSSWAYDLLVDFFDEAGTHTSVLRADSALVRERQRGLEVFGNVHITADKGTKLKSEHLAWEDSKRLIHTDGYVVITRSKDIMAGYGFESDPELTRIKLRRQVTGSMTDTKKLTDSL
jgi:LPS export ABC transporter protein LptC